MSQTKTPTRKQVPINIPIDLLEKLDDYCQKHYVPRTSIVLMSIAQFLEKEVSDIDSE